jgi:hypothetical protein
MDQPAAMDGWPKSTSRSRLAVRAQCGGKHKREAEYHGPSGDPVGPGTYSLSGTWARTPACLARGRSSRVDEHQPSAGPDFPHSATHGGRGSPAIAHGYAALDRNAILTSATALDPLTYILDFSPPNIGLGCSWHRRDANSAPGS